MTKGIAILGSTGSIGTSALDVVESFPEHFRVVALAAGRNVELLAVQARTHRPALLSVAREEDVPKLRELLGSELASATEITCGIAGAEQVASRDDVSLVLTAMVGAIGLKPTLRAIERGIEVGICNKEPLVVAGELCTSAAREHGATLLPVDSEHNAIYQCLRGQRRQDVARILLTCSGGPFRQVHDLERVTLEQALEHPTWSMGPKITIDSATLMNKGLEVIEARWLFDLPADHIEVVIHPQSVIHSMVEYVDGSVIAQLGTPDMRVPIGYALGYPARLPLFVPKLDFAEVAALTFEKPDRQRFVALDICYEALRQGGTAPAVVNAANEVAVAAFLQRRIGYLQICDTIRRTLEAHEVGSGSALDELLAADAWARRRAGEIVASTE